MWKALIAVAAAAVIANSSLLFAQERAAPSAASPAEGEYGHEDYDWQPSAEYDQDYGWRQSADYDQENGPHWQPSAEDVSAFMDARIAALRAGLRLTPDQEKNWPAFESAVRDMAKARAQRWAMRQHEQPPADPVERLQQHADALSSVAAGLKKLADAEGPLYKSLDDAQKHRFEILAQGLRPHHFFAGWNGSDRNGEGCGWRQHHTD
jgi:zinc resistance-associated protein